MIGVELQSNTPDPANQGLQDYEKLPSRCEWELVGSKLCRAAALQELSLTPLVYSIATDLFFFFQSVQRNASTGSASDGEIEKFIKRWLLLTLDRDGGRKPFSQRFFKDPSLSYLFIIWRTFFHHKEPFVKPKGSSDVKGSLWNHLDKKVLLWHREAPLFLRVYVPNINIYQSYHSCYQSEIVWITMCHSLSLPLFVPLLGYAYLRKLLEFLFFYFLKF